MDELLQYEVVYTDAAISDMREKAAYISGRLREPLLAKRWYLRLREEIQRELSTFPLKFSLYQVSPWRERGVRLLIAKNDVVLYSVDQEHRFVHIRAICTRGKDLAAHLEETFS